MSQPPAWPDPAQVSAEEMIDHLGLEPLPEEGGWFRRTVTGPFIDGRAKASAYAAIDALFTPAGFSALHRLEMDEVWMFRAGDALQLWQLNESGDANGTTLGWTAPRSEREVRVPARTWQGARLVEGGRWAWVSCITIPAFTWEGFQLASRGGLTSRFPRWSKEIAALTRA